MTIYIGQTDTLYKTYGDMVIVIPSYKSRDRVLPPPPPIHTNNK